MSHSKPTGGATVIAPDPTTGSQVHRATARDIPALSRALAEAFHDDPVFEWLIPADDARGTILPRLFDLIVKANLVHEDTYIAGGGAGGAVWVPSSEDDDDHQAISALADVLGAFAPRLFTIVDLMNADHPRVPHEYLFFVGTRPRWQGRGIGSGLMRPVLNRCDRDGTPAYLEATSPRNRRLYLRHGFNVTSEIPLPDGPTMWRMWRDPAGSASGRRGHADL